MSNDSSIDLDPEIAAILREAAALNPSDPTTLPIAAARAQLTAASLAWNVELPALPALRDMKVQGPDGAIRLRLYRPRAAGQLPAVVYLHGGGWTFGSVDTHDRLMRLLALAADAAVIGVDYRLAPEHPFPAPLEDCLAAIRWVDGHADELGVDGRRIVVAGDSAGANLALASLLALRDASDPPLRGAALLYGCYCSRLDTPSHALFGDGSYRLSTAEMGWFWGNYLGTTPAGHPLAEPLHADLAGLPPVLLDAGGGRPACRRQALAGAALGRRRRAARATGLPRHRPRLLADDGTQRRCPPCAGRYRTRDQGIC